MAMICAMHAPTMSRQTVQTTRRLLVFTGFLLIGCNRSQGPPQGKPVMEHALRPSTAQTADPPTSSSELEGVNSREIPGSEPPPGTHKEQVDRSIEHGDRADLHDAMEQVFLRDIRDSGIKTVEEACRGMPSRGMDGQLVFGDLDDDGREEAAMTAYSCFAGTGGPDLFAVFKLSADGKVNEIEFEPRKANEPFKGREVSSGLRGKMRIAIEKGQLIEEFPVYDEKDANCCASGGTRRFIYRWNGNKLALKDVIDLPPSASRN